MPNNYKITLFYNQFTQGWTETWYYTGTLSPSYFTDTPLPSLLFNSIQFRAVGTSLVAARYSIIGQPRSTFTTFFGNKYVTPPVAGGKPADVSAEDLLIKLLANGGATKHMYIRGLQWQDTQRDPETGLPDISAFLLQGLQQYLTSCFINQWAIQAQQNPFANPGLFNAQVVSIAPTAGNSEQSDLVINFAPVFAGTNPSVIFHGVDKNDLPGFPRACPVVAYGNAPSPYIRIPYRFRAATNPYLPQRLTLWQQLYTYQPILQPQVSSGQLQIINLLTRKTGKAFFVPRGRTRAAITRR